MYQIGGRRALYAGFVPTQLWLLLGTTNCSLKVEGDENKSLVHFMVNNNAVLNLMLFGPGTILMIRMQCIDFPYRNQFLKSTFDMVKNDGIRMFYRGIPVILVGQLFVVAACKFVDYYRSKNELRQHQLRTIEELAGELSTEERDLLNRGLKWHEKKAISL